MLEARAVNQRYIRKERSSLPEMRVYSAAREPK